MVGHLLVALCMACITCVTSDDSFTMAHSYSMLVHLTFDLMISLEPAYYCSWFAGHGCAVHLHFLPFHIRVLLHINDQVVWWNWNNNKDRVEGHSKRWVIIMEICLLEQREARIKATDTLKASANTQQTTPGLIYKTQQNCCSWQPKSPSSYCLASRGGTSATTMLLLAAYQMAFPSPCLL